MNKKVGIVLVNFHDYAQRFLTNCRDSLRKQDYPKDDFQIYIVDNDSSAETFSYLKQEFPEAVVLKRSDGNYCAANNLGFKEAIKEGADYLIALNMDTELHFSFITEMVQALENNDKAGMAQAKILLHKKNSSGGERINSLGNIIQYLGFGFTSGYNEKDREILGYPEIKGYASGCAFIIRAEVFTQVGGLNEEYYMYHDDMELSLKLRLVGQKIILAPQAVVYHKYEFSRSVLMYYYMERNRYLTLLIFASKKYLALIFLPLFFMDLGMFFFTIFTGRFKELLKVYSYFLKKSTADKIMDSRAQLKKITKVPFNTIARDFRPKIEFQEINNPLLSYIVNPLMSAYWFLIKKII